LRIDRELTVAGVHDLAAGSFHAEQPAVAIHSQVELAACSADNADAEILVYRGDLSPQTDARAGVNISERDGGRLEADRAGVGDVVADDVQFLGSAFETAESLSETHDSTSYLFDVCSLCSAGRHT